MHPLPTIGGGRCLIIGEVAMTHDGSLGLAHAFIDAKAVRAIQKFRSLSLEKLAQCDGAAQDRGVR